MDSAVSHALLVCAGGFPPACTVCPARSPAAGFPHALGATGQPVQPLSRVQNSGHVCDGIKLFPCLCGLALPPATHVGFQQDRQPAHPQGRRRLPAEGELFIHTSVKQLHPTRLGMPTVCSQKPTGTPAWPPNPPSPELEDVGLPGTQFPQPCSVHESAPWSMTERKATKPGRTRVQETEWRNPLSRGFSPGTNVASTDPHPNGSPGLITPSAGNFRLLRTQ